MAKHPHLTKMMLGGAALIAAGTAAQSMSVGSAGCVLGAAASGPVGASVAGLLGFASSFAGGWFSNRFHDKYKALEYELNDPSDVLRNHYLQRLVTQAIVLGIRHSASEPNLDTATVRALRNLESFAKTHFEDNAAIGDRLDLAEPQIERFFTGKWDDFNRVPAPSQAQWREFLEEAGGKPSDSSMALAMDLAAQSLSRHFAQLLFDNAKIASEDDRPAYAALELMLIRTLATTLADHGEQLARIDAAAAGTVHELVSIKSELTALRESLAALPSGLESRLVLPDLRPFASLKVSARSTGLIVPGAVSSVDARLADIEDVVRATHRVSTKTLDLLMGDRTLLAKLPSVGDVIRDNANRIWTVGKLFSSGPAGCVVLGEHRGKHAVFKLCVIEAFARSFSREVEAATALQDLDDPHARFCKITDSKLPVRVLRGSAPAEPSAQPPYWLQLEYFSLGNLASWWTSQALAPADRSQQAAMIVADIARTVALAHSRNILHRDLKPSNILMGEDSTHGVVPYVSDFGIASFSDPQRSASLQEHAGGRTIHAKGNDAVAHQGTLLYMAPELYERSADNRPVAPPSVVTDVFSLGMILYWLLTGRQERPTRELVQAHIDDRALGYIVRRATHREPLLRFQSAGELVEAIRTREFLSPRLTELEDALLTDIDRLALERERLQASQEQRARADRERERAESQSARAMRLVRKLRWSAAGLAILAVVAGIGVIMSDRLARERAAAEASARAAELVAREAEQKSLMSLASAKGSLVDALVRESDFWREASDYPRSADAARRALRAALEPIAGNRDQASIFAGVGAGYRVLDGFGDQFIQLRSRFGPPDGSPAAFVVCPDNEHVCVGTQSGELSIWHARTAELVGQVQHRASVDAVEFVPGTSTALSVSLDGRVVQFDYRTGVVGYEYLHPRAVRSVRVAPDAQHFLTWCDDLSIRVWRMGGDRAVAEFKSGHLRGEVYDLGNGAIGVLSNKGLAVVDTATWTVREQHAGSRIAIADEQPRHVLVSEGRGGRSKVVMIGTDRTTEAGVTTTGTGLRRAAWVPGTSWVCELFGDPLVRFWNTGASTEQFEFTAERLTQDVTAYREPRLAVAPQGGRVALYGGMGHWSTWSVPTGRRIAEGKHDARVIDVQWTPSGESFLLVTNQTIEQRSAENGRLLNSYKASDRIVRVRYTSDGGRIWISTQDGLLVLISARTFEVTAELKHDDAVMDWEPFGEYGVATLTENASVSLWELNADYQWRDTRSVKLSGDGAWLARANGQWLSIYARGALTPAAVHDLGHPVTSISATSEGSMFIATTSENRQVAVDGGRTEINPIELAEGTLAICPRGDAAVVRSEGPRTQLIWRNDNGRLSVAEYDFAAKAIRQAPDGSVVVLVGKDGAALIVSLADGEMEDLFSLPPEFDELLAVTEDGVVVREGDAISAVLRDGSVHQLEAPEGSKYITGDGILAWTPAGSIAYWKTPVSATPTTWRTSGAIGAVWLSPRGRLAVVHEENDQVAQTHFIALDESSRSPFIAFERPSKAWSRRVDTWAFSSDEKIIAGWGEDAMIRWWKSDGRLGSRIEHSSPIEGALFDMSGGVMVYWDDRGSIYRRSLAPEVVLSETRLGEAIARVQHAGEDEIAVVSASGGLRFLAMAHRPEDLLARLDALADRIRTSDTVTRQGTPGVLSTHWGDLAEELHRTADAPMEFGQLNDGGIMLVSGKPLPDIVIHAEYSRRTRQITLVFMDRGVLTMHYRVPSEMQSALEASGELIIYMLFPDDDPLGYIVPLIVY